MNATMQLVSKLSLKQIIGKLDVKALHALPEGQQEVELFNIGGTCTGTKLGMTTFGEFCAFLGNFAAVRITDGMVFRAPQLFLPTVAEAFIRPVVDAASGQPVEFGFIIGVKPLTKPDGTLSYEYTVKPIVAPDTVDPLAEMLKKLQGTPRLLGASSVAEVVDATTGEIQPAEQAPETPADPKKDHGKKK
jgi:hypothetical protein